MDFKFLRNTILFNDLFSVSHIQLKETTLLFKDLFRSMESELRNEKDHFQSDILKNLLHNFLLLSERERRKQNFSEIKKSADLDYVLLFRDLLENQYRKQKQVRSYCEQMHVTEKRLNHATTIILGKSPKQMIDERIMLEAKRLLAHSTESVKEIGFELGFDESTNFIKYFRKHDHSTPLDFRERFSV